ncbi:MULTISPECIES: acyltransferase family protein [unclassified Microbacterium]|uniref:acyltransferase family protein n=1 Tax=unclassified Microbacterium TaxID=2609290 RepID=UPI002469BC2D|nr:MULTISPECIES: acyltransferase family protein [unclassified Microbacterium]MDH5131618.1 acyltransferase family protein [Microbacterium sp. RD10]MDH5135103.1 acyltransferase family protein [Microbacterium sp. RD11]MDH5144467.1 acyltransferase family protein [Microbacterium sp. RD12]MDH5153411.1 acyltransferase family protein [Microbacterium sp. RD06]MDH5165210.1 acyltransferase family protein [Microbacterium sp. RD02]
MSTRPAPPQGHLPHIQGLRALAVLAVVLYHFWPARFSGGYVGVDVFFVISGFLITGHLVRELTSTGTVHIGRFWARRARRLLPASLLVLLFCVTVVALRQLTPISALPEELRQIVTSAFSVQNWYLASAATDYLGQTGDPTTVQHYWSLSLEEQFYVLWPVLLVLTGWLAVKRIHGEHRKVIAVVVGVLSTASFVSCVALTAAYPAPAYFVTPVRLWEFGVGALLSLLPALRARRPLTSALLGGAGLVAILFSISFFDGQTAFPGYAAAVPTIGAAAVIAATNAARWWLPARLLAIRPLRFTGDISFSLYLWHWPLIVIAPSVPFWGLSLAHRLALLALSFVVAWLTKRFIEDPARTWRAPSLRRPRVVLALALAGMTVVGAGAGAAWAVNAPTYERDATALAAVRAHPPACFGAQAVLDIRCADSRSASVIPTPGFAGADRPTEQKCFVQLNDSRAVACRFGSRTTDAPSIALVGDSHAFQYVSTFRAMAEKEGWSLTTYVKGACPWNTTPLATGGAFGAACSEWRDEVTAALEGGDFDVVFTTALAATPFAQAGHESTLHAAASGYRAAWSRVISEGTRVIALVDNPAWATDPNKCLQTRSPEACSVSRDDALAASDPIRAAGEDFPGVTVLDFTPVFCSSSECLPVIGGANAYRDHDHLTTTFTDTLAPQLRAALRDAITR